MRRFLSNYFDLLFELQHQHTERLTKTGDCIEQYVSIIVAFVLNGTGCRQSGCSQEDGGRCIATRYFLAWHRRPVQLSVNAAVLNFTFFDLVV